VSVGTLPYGRGTLHVSVPPFLKSAAFGQQAWAFVFYNEHRIFASFWFSAFHNLFQTPCGILGNKKSENNIPPEFHRSGVCNQANKCHSRYRGISPIKNKKASNIPAKRHSDTTDNLEK